MLVSFYNKTLSLESRLNALQKHSTTDGLPPALHSAITNAVSAEVKPVNSIYSYLHFINDDFDNALSS